jgi:hypothetical protein
VAVKAALLDVVDFCINGPMFIGRCICRIAAPLKAEVRLAASSIDPELLEPRLL